MTHPMPDWLDPAPWLGLAAEADTADVRRALACDTPGEREMAALLSPAAGDHLEAMAQRARTLTRRHFGRTLSLYAPLYLSNYCSGGCAYCGFASDRDVPRHRLAPEETAAELDALKRMRIDEVLLLTGERTPQADFGYLHEAVALAAERFDGVLVEAFPMTAEEYARLARAGCRGLTLYQETYDPAQYERLHRWGPKRGYAARLDAPARALGAGLRVAGLGALLGLADPRFDVLCLFRHAQALRRRYWRAGVTLSFPRVRPQAGAFAPPFPVDERFLAQIICACRLCLPDVPLVLSTRERPTFRDGMAGVGISKMSVASRTTVGGYGAAHGAEEQFAVSDDRGVAAFCDALRARGLQPVFKNWDAVYREAPA